MEVSAAAERHQTFRDDRGAGVIVFDAVRLRQAGPELLDPAHYGAAASAVGEGGRGAAWFVPGDAGEAVLRHYRRGGLAAKLGCRRYAWLGESRVRSLAEFRLLGQLHREGLPVPAPLVAGYWRRGWGYGAAILVERIAGARALSQWLGQDVDQAPWEAVGEVLARFHLAGVDHADLNADNVLVDPDGRVWLIDFDRCLRRRSGGAWRERNLRRLARSLAKLSRGGMRWQPGFSRLRRAYADAVKGVPA
ncbi:MAG: 3-deoxy-D-manno-octulosonic acid kinase [Arenimonas sp.]|uniref:3-deoxy-D-manno-octulosonic acid kinase n=1 Tax=Arenimonas sp. TaxID=1872635 RepID=UPI0025BDF588|nr:3-deoxy-D-manno-octulosonic acid kinase [Arenimonas sp.]MBW8367331.1 3-deoxy-D-manno-octulosonic acid kinase [Arenimonas sp.]